MCYFGAHFIYRVRGMHAGMRRVSGPPRVVDVYLQEWVVMGAQRMTKFDKYRYNMLRREEQASSKEFSKVNTEVTHDIHTHGFYIL